MKCPMRVSLAMIALSGQFWSTAGVAVHEEKNALYAVVEATEGV